MGKLFDHILKTSLSLSYLERRRLVNFLLKELGEEEISVLEPTLRDRVSGLFEQVEEVEQWLMRIRKRFNIGAGLRARLNDHG